jgi:hypothetical protein
MQLEPFVKSKCPCEDAAGDPMIAKDRDDESVSPRKEEMANHAFIRGPARGEQSLISPDAKVRYAAHFGLRADIGVSLKSTNNGHSATLYIMSRARDQNWGPTYLRRLMSDCPCSGNSSVGVTWPTSMPVVTDVLMYFVSPAANWNVTAFSTSVTVVTAYFPGGRST